MASAVLIAQGLTQTSSEKLLPVADGNKYRDSQLDNVRDLETLSPKWNVSLKFLPSELREL